MPDSTWPSWADRRTRADLTFELRIGTDHLSDIRKMVDFVKADTGLPVWLIGTSRGSVSATAAAIAFPPDLLAGVVLSSSVVRNKPGALPDQKLSAIRVPVLLVHHKLDACPICRPDDLAGVLDALTKAPMKKLMMLDGGGPPRVLPAKRCITTASSAWSARQCGRSRTGLRSRYVEPLRPSKW